MKNEITYNQPLSQESIEDIKTIFVNGYSIELDADNSGLIENYPVVEFVVTSIAGGLIYDGFILGVKTLYKNLKSRKEDKNFKIILEKDEKLAYISEDEIYIHSNGERTYFDTIDEMKSQL